jgi:uncharacterized tellurite resistance protein B-like protein
MVLHLRDARMIRRLSEFFAELTGRKGGHAFALDDHRVAAAALLLHVVGVDGKSAPAEQAKLATLMQARFGLDADTAAAVISAADAREREAVDVAEFTSLLKRALSPEGRVRLVDMLWEIVLSDGGAHEFEETMVSRIADLLGVSDHDRLVSRRRVAAEDPGEEQA